jgi:hypothetical protein
MLSATELRIGNLVNYDTAEGDVFTNVIDWEDLKWLSEDEKGFNLVHNPIPLTEEWLLKFPKDLHLKDIPSWINYIHELQNWYFIQNKCKKELIFM